MSNPFEEGQRRRRRHEAAYVRARLTFERTARGWSRPAMCAALADRGCYLTPQDLYTIESPPEGRAPRAVRVDELMAMAEVFGMPIESMFVPPGPALQKVVQEALDDLGLQQQLLYKAYRDFAKAFEILRPFLADDTDWHRVRLLKNAVESPVMDLIDIAMELESGLESGDIDAANIKFPSTRGRRGK